MRIDSHCVYAFCLKLKEFLINLERSHSQS